MEVRLNNIPKLDEYVIRLGVLNERMLGYIYPDKTSFVVALAVESGGYFFVGCYQYETVCVL